MRAAVIAAAALGPLAACADRGPIGCGEPRYYAIDRVGLPGDHRAYELDLDGDGRRDDVYANLVAIVRYDRTVGDVDAIASARFARRDAIWLVGVAACEDGWSQVELRRGEDADGDGVPELVPGPAPFSATGAPIEGAGGEADVPITPLVDPRGDFLPIAWARAGLAATSLDVTDTSLHGAIGFALPMPGSQHDVLAPYAAYLTIELAAGTSPIALQVDHDHDGVVTTDELAVYPLVQPWIQPDLALKGHGYPADVWSVGLAIEARRTPIE